MKYYVYKITNKINGKIYIGFHGCVCDFLEDNYYGSGCLIKKALKKYGKENFEREVLFSYDSEEEAKGKEREIVNEDFLKQDNVYNVALGGYGGGLIGETNPFYGKKHTDKTLQILSDKGKERTHTEESKKKIGESVRSSEKYKEGISKRKKRPKKERVKVIKSKEEKSINHSNARKRWIQEHPEEHKQAMEKINKNPEKIEKTAQKHRGMKRSKEACKNISISLIGKNKGKDNKEFIGYYITPFGKFESLESASIASGCCKIAVRDRCRIKNGNKVGLTSVVTDKSGKLTKDMVGKTWKELGWGFEDA